MVISAALGRTEDPSRGRPEFDVERSFSSICSRFTVR
jgi:hypothetical protein